ncbi:MAG TPA: TetR family transcriptional regulator [Kineosporiaceae bacterium]|nr:TetR family transcriptional regulator [Kineosporiaceae bacterium]
MISEVPRTSTRDRILEAAEDVVLTDGVAALTLDKAAARAGVSKGGVLYHFPNRSALVSAMVRRLSEQFDAGLDAYRVDDSPGSFARAYIRECFAAPEGEQQERAEQLGAALLAAMASEPHLLDPLREAFAGWQQRLVADAPDPVRATITRLAADGLWLCELFGLAELTPDLRDQVRVELERMTREGGAR